MKISCPFSNICGRIWPYLLLAGLVTVFFWDSFFAGKILCMRDTFCDTGRIFVRQAIHDGAIPFWNHYSNSGQPFIAEPLTAFFYPLNILLYVLPATFALKLSLALHLFIASASCYALMRHWKVNIAGALLTAVSFTFSTYLIAQMEFLTLFSAAAWTPMILLLTSLLISRWHSSEQQKLVYKVGRILPVVAALAAVLATQFLAGNTQPFLFSLLLAFAYLVVRCATLRSIKLLTSMVIIFGLAGFLALCLSMVQFLLTWELIPYSIRGENFDPELNTASLHPRLLISWVLPFFAGRPGYNNTWWGRSINPQADMSMFEFWVGTGYIGIAPLILVSMAPLYLWRRQRQAAGSYRFLILFFIAAALGGLIIAMGKYTPVYEFLYNHIPGVDRFRWPAKALQVVVMSTSILAGLGLHAITDSHRQPAALQRFNRYKIAWLVWLAVLIVMTAVYYAAGRSPNFYTWLTGGAFKHLPQQPQRLEGLVMDYKLAVVFFMVSLVLIESVLRNQRRPLTKAAAVILITYINLFLISRQIHFITADGIYEERPQTTLERINFNEPVRIANSFEFFGQQMLYGASDEKLYRFAKLAGIGETFLPYHIFKTGGGGTLRIKRYKIFFDNLFLIKPDDSRWQRIADLLNIRYIIYGPDMTNIVLGLEPAKLRLIERPHHLPRALVVEHWNVAADDKDAIRALMLPSFEPCQSAVIDGLPAGRTLPPPALSAQKNFPSSYKNYGVDSISYDWNKVHIKAEANKQSLLVLNDTWYPGWKAFVDGKQEPIVRANFIFRGVFLEPGRHDVLFVYQPWQFKAGATVSIMTLLILFISGYLGHRFAIYARGQLNEKSN